MNNIKNPIYFFVIIFLFFLFPMAKAIGNLGAVFMLIAGLFFLLKDLRCKKFERGILVIGAPFIIIFMLAIVGAFYGDAAWELKIDFLLKALRYPVIFFGAYFLYRFDLGGVALKSFSASIIVILAMVYASVAIQLPWAPNIQKGWGGDHAIFGDYITQNIMVSFFAVLMLHLSLQSQQRIIRIACAALFVLASIAVMALSYGRTGYVMLLTAFLGYCLCFFKNRHWRVAACLLTIFSFAGLYFGVDNFQNRINLAYSELMSADGQNSLTSIGARLLMWSTAWDIGWANLWWGVGSGSYTAEWCARVNESAWCEIGQHPHNNFLLLFASNGIFSAIIYGFILLSAVFLFLKRSSGDCYIGLVFLIILFLDSLLNGAFWNIREANFFTLIGASVLVIIFNKLFRRNEML